MTALDWRNRPYPEPTPQPPTDVSAAACRARAERQERRWQRQWRIVSRIALVVAGLLALWLYSTADFTRTEELVLIAVLLLLRILYVVERRDTAHNI
jgi:uncharacterized membrane protein YfhO